MDFQKQCKSLYFLPSLGMEHFHCVQIFCAALSLLAIVDFSLAAATDTLSPGQTLSDGQVLASADQIFELGFFSPGNSTDRFLGIWYKATPDVVVWVANRENPIPAAEGGGILALASNGTLLILSSSQRRTIWSSNSSIPASSPALHLLNTGNLVVVDNSTDVWMSFDYPGDSRVPGMKMVDDPDAGLDKHLTSWKSPNDPTMGDFVYRIENHGLPHPSIYKGNLKIYRGGPWNGKNFTGLPFIDERGVFKNGRVVSLTNPYNNSFYLRLTMSYTGLLELYILNEKRDDWIRAYTMPNDTCDNYGWCGPNSVCRSYETPVCECLNGFIPKSQKEWDVFSWRSGCSRIPPLDCRSEDGFKKFDSIKYPDTYPLSFRAQNSMNADDCREECLRNCKCSAYADPYFSNEKIGCLMWFEDLVDIREFIGEVSISPSIYIRVPKTEQDPMTDWSKKKGSKRLVYLATAASVAVLGFILCLGGLFLNMRRRRVARKKEGEDFELPLFSLATIVAATNNFSDENFIGKGGFGPVYKGNLSAELEIAVKRMSRTSGQGSKEFKNEVILIAKLQHRNLVRILGCCIEGGEKMLVYEYMPTKSLNYFIFDQKRKEVLSWQTRFDIIMGIARGLLYLHHDSRLKIIHRDLKTSNILLDEKLNAKISDFGLARMFEGDQTMAKTKRVVGTYGYMAPEYVFHGNFSLKSDVYSLGVVILEIVSGKKNRGFKHPSSYQNLLEEAYLLWKEKREMELMDECYNTSFVDSQVKRCIQIGLLCVQSEAKERPMMPFVIQMLSSDDTALPLPQKPGFFVESSSSGSEEHRTGSISITQLVGR